MGCGSVRDAVRSETETSMKELKPDDDEEKLMGGGHACVWLGYPNSSPASGLKSINVSVMVTWSI